MCEAIEDLYDKFTKLELQVKYLEEAAQGEHIIVDFVRMNEDAKIPTKANPEDAGWDLYSAVDISLLYGVPTLVSTGIKFGMPPYYHGFVWDRSSMGKKGIHVLGGMIDNPYTGEVGVLLINLNREVRLYELDKGDKITQIVFTKLPISYLNEKDELGSTSRGDKGFGSSGK